jgi:DNA-binding response OmpR family regulator
MKILVIEDEEAIRALFTNLLEDAGYVVLAARDGAEARVHWEKHAESIELLIADLMLPGSSGFDLAQEFRHRRPGLKILFASGNPRDELLETTQVIRGSRMMMKPFAMKQLLEVVADMVDGSPSRNLNR